MSESKSTPSSDEAIYRIGAACRLTGISQHVLRIWEKRYGVVEPQRSETGRRLYRERDIQRLSMLKILVDHGQAIGTIADLDDDELARRVRQAAGASPAGGASQMPRLALVGESLAIMSEDCEASDAFELVGHYHAVTDLTTHKPVRRLDVAVLEWPNLQPDDAIEITRLANRLNARYLVLVYDYASRAVLRRLVNERVTALRSPLDIVALEAVVAWRFGRMAPLVDAAELPSAAMPSRQFNDRELAFLAAQSSTIACECPMHLAQLITKLVHFEAYSAECESRAADDAALHAYLHSTTSRARSLMERALARVVELENLSMPGD